MNGWSIAGRAACYTSIGAGVEWLVNNLKILDDAIYTYIYTYINTYIHAYIYKHIDRCGS